MTPITDIRVVQYQEWLEQEDGTKKMLPTSYCIEVQRDDGAGWHPIKVEFVTLGGKDD